MLRAACISHKFWNEYVLMNLTVWEMQWWPFYFLVIFECLLIIDEPGSFLPKQTKKSRQNKLTKDNCVPKVTTFSFCLFEFSLEMSGTKTFFYVKKVLVFPLTFSIENFDYVLSSF